jgi:hypothetical protein
MSILLAIAGIWAVLLTAAYLSRVSAGLGKRSSAAIVTVSYCILSALTLAWLGMNPTGLVAVFGMSLPFAVAICATMTSPPRRDH